MSVAELIDANRRYASARGKQDPGSAPPRLRVAVVTCMDARIDPLAIFGLTLGDAHVVRNAGARVTDDVRRSLALSSHVLGVTAVVIMQHTACGLTGTTDSELRGLTGAPVAFHAIVDHAADLVADVDALATTSYLAPIDTIVGVLYDLASGSVTEHASWRRPT